MAASITPTLRALAIVVAMAFLAGCRVVLIPGQGGRIEGSNGTQCAEAELCEIRVETADFFEEYRAVPEPGWKFLHWKDRGGGLCRGSKLDSCSVDTTNFAAFPTLVELLPLNIRYFMEPVFVPDEPLVVAWSKVFTVTTETAFCGIRGTGVPIEGSQYSARLTMYESGLLRMETLDSGFLDIDDPLRVDEFFWTRSADGVYIQEFRWEWEFDGEWRLALGHVTWQLDPESTEMSTRQFSTEMLWPDIFDSESLAGFQCKFTTRAAGTLAPGGN